MQIKGGKVSNLYYMRTSEMTQKSRTDRKIEG